MTARTVAIIGAGRVGCSVGYLLKQGGYRVTGVAARSAASAAQAASFIGQGQPTTDAAQAASGAELVFITTPDRVIQQVCETLAASGALGPASVVIHMSGAHSLGLLSAAVKAGALRAVLHPLQSLASREQGVKTLPGSYFRVEADPMARETARSLVTALGGTELVMPEWSSDQDSAALYHAGAVAVSNYFVALVRYGLKFYQALGADKQEALKAVLPLIKGTLLNIEALGIPDALTGPIMRGDSETVRGHLAAMRRKAPHLAGLYKELARETVEVARDKGSIDGKKAEELLKLLTNAECGVRIPE
ncbi:MAG: hypothetical protein A2010_13685 [Nitrospirae bacterium GWD2_57_9]|nr:MAG: hypothetical protein A2010_13685 [Nitrospirae bacterium GWD2_57_9]